MCAGAAGATTPEVFACSGNFFSQDPKWCAALNRGMLDDPDNGDITRYYQTEPFNSYSKWVHSTCPGLYAFPYDDYGPTNESGFHSCGGGTQLNITFFQAGDWPDRLPRGAEGDVQLRAADAAVEAALVGLAVVVVGEGVDAGAGGVDPL